MHFRRPYKSTRYRNESCRSKVKGCCDKDSLFALDAVSYAESHRDEQVVFLAVGFETTTPSACLAVEKAKKLGLENFSILGANKTMPNAYKALEEAQTHFCTPAMSTLSQAQPYARSL